MSGGRTLAGIPHSIHLRAMAKPLHVKAIMQNCKALRMTRHAALHAPSFAPTFSGSGFCCSPALISEIPRVLWRKRTEAISPFRVATLDRISGVESWRKSAACGN